MRRWTTAVIAVAKFLRNAIGVALLVSVIGAGEAWAAPLDNYVAPHIGGHVTDPEGKLTGAEKQEIEDSFGKVQEDTKVNLAAFIAAAAPKDVETVGRAAFDQWKIGHDWMTGILLTISADGQVCRIIVPTDKPPPIPQATIAEIEGAVSALSQKGHFIEGLRVASERIGKLLRADAKSPSVRPRGRRNLAWSTRYALGALLVTYLAAFLWLRRMKTWNGAALPRTSRLASWLATAWARVVVRRDIVLLGLLVIGAWARVYRIAKPDGSLIFDEAYYVQDARVLLGYPVLLDHLPAHALSGLDPNSEHPPLAKLIMAASIHRFGETGLGWRMPSVVLGVLSIWMIYRLVLTLGGEQSQARIAAFVMTFENLAFVHGRIATLDIYVLAFMLLGTWLYVSGLFEFAGLAFGLATLCKVNGLLGVFAIFAFEIGSAFRKNEGRPTARSLAPLTSMVGIYLAFTLLALGALDCAWTEFRNPFAHLAHIFQYGASLTRTGGVQGAESTPFQWWLNESPINYLMVQTNSNGITRTQILFRGAMTEYVIFAAPFAIAFAVRSALRGSRFAWLVVCLFAANYLPLLCAWAFASRISYIYYMLQAVPAFALAIAFASTAVPRFLRRCFVVAVLFSFGTWFPFRWY